MSWISRFARVMRRGRVDRDLDEEIRFHLEARTDEYVRSGMAPEEARARARRQFGNPVLAREASHDVKVLPWLESIVRDIGFAVRLSRRNKTVTVAAVVSLSLAIGACAAAFSLIDALVLRTLPVADPQSLIYIAMRAPADDRDALSFNYPLFRDLRRAGTDHVRLFALSDQSRRDATFDDASQSEKVYAQWVSGDTFEILGLTPSLGRLLTSTDDVIPDQHPVAVLSYDFWNRRFGGRPDVLGRSVTVRGKTLQIVGVGPRGFTGVEPGIGTDLWAPTMMWDARAISDPSTRWFRTWGRLKPGTAVEPARSVLQAVFTNFRRNQAAELTEESPARIAQFLDTRLYLRSATNGPSALRDTFERALWTLGGIAGVVLLLTCANIASLLVARATAREREMALRVSIGAGRGRLIQQTLIESGLLAFASCLFGALFASIATPQIVSMISTSRTVVHLDTPLDWRLALFLAAAGGIVTFVFGLAPALRASAVSPVDVLKTIGGRQTSRLGSFRPLIAAQVAFGFVVLFVAGLCLTSFAKLLQTDLGFDRSEVALVALPAGTVRYDNGQESAAWQQMLERLRQVPGIESAGLAPWALFQGSGRNKGVRIPGRPDDSYLPWYLPVSPGFLHTMRIPLLAGRDLDWRDARMPAPSAVIVNESFVRRYFPGESPLGRRFFRVDGGATLAAQEIVGIVRDAKYTDLREPAPPTVYDVYQPADTAVLHVRTQLDTAALTAILSKELPGAADAFHSGGITWQSTLVANHMVRDRAIALLSAFFAVVAIVLVIVGLYGVLSYTVLQQSREIGIRLALGAPPRRVLESILWSIGPFALAGLLVGAIGSALAGRFVSALLFEVQPGDGWNAVPPLICLLLACAGAALIPALRAIRIDPTMTLRSD